MGHWPVLGSQGRREPCEEGTRDVGGGKVGEAQEGPQPLSPLSLGNVGCQPQEEWHLESSVSHLCLGGQVGGVRAGRCPVTGAAGLGPGGPESVCR